MAQHRSYPAFVKMAARKYFRGHYDRKQRKAMWAKTLEIYRGFVEEAPDIGGRENNMAKNLYMALAVFAFYEATGRSITPEALEELVMGSVPKRLPAVMDLNKPANQQKLRARFEKYKALSDEKLDHGQWGNSWRVEMDPHGRKTGVAFDLVGCPLADFASSHGYGEILPVLCRFDYVSAKVFRAKLIREHTVAEGSPYCDYWYVGDREDV